MNAMKIKQKEICFIIVTNKFNKEDDGFVATCIELDIVSQGDTIEEASKNLDEAVLCYLNTLENLGIREEVFKEKNIILHKYPKTSDNTAINIPINQEAFITARTFDVAC